MSNESIVLNRVVSLCSQGYASANPALYDEIAKELLTLEQSDEVAGLVRLSQGAKGLSSPRFAYPHIADRARELAQKSA